MPPMTTGIHRLWGGDIHVDFENVPESVQSFLKPYRQGRDEQQENGMGMDL